MSDHNPVVRRPQTRREAAALRKLTETGAIPIIVDEPDAPTATEVATGEFAVVATAEATAVPETAAISADSPDESAPEDAMPAESAAEAKSSGDDASSDESDDGESASSDEDETAESATGAAAADKTGQDTTTQNKSAGKTAKSARAPIASGVGLTKIYGTGTTEVRALDGVDVEFYRGELTAIMGPSGSGKSTLMHCMAGLDRATSGTIWVDGMTVSDMNQSELTKLRRNHIGFVFQAYNLVPTLTAAENITLPLDIAHKPVDSTWFDEVVAILGLTDRLTHRPSELSGGQQQRVAVARALISRPAVIFADEPTGNLDSKSAAEVLGFLREGADAMNQSIVIVTHDPKAASYAHRVIFLADGKVDGELPDPTVETILDRLREAE